MVKVIESIEAGNSKKKILECVSDMDSVCQLLKQVISNLHDEEELKNIEKIIVDVSDNLDNITLLMSLIFLIGSTSVFVLMI